MTPMLTKEEYHKWYKRLMVGGILVLIFVVVFRLLGEFDNRFSILIGLSAVLFIWQGYRGMRYKMDQGKYKSKENNEKL